ncbi:spermatogenesis-associated protein [Anaeramoeba ignava]|uniref:Spermatogenesis-associated protein n=1 Tax=Anaeramoeba ignava TaxID=1746090 RepID=A0A9Q0LWV0_ANAIG|nr:spermatogenesis-associated protein [Anaeramoeba ignava]
MISSYLIKKPHSFQNYFLKSFSNRLSKESSLYLQKHANDPVDWFPFGKEAIEKSKKLNLPIFISIGFNSCHFCHKMHNESFQNKAIASILNKHFINIKVDREERPDLDSIYIHFVSMFTGNAGWPLSVFTLPNLTPFFGASYFPPLQFQNLLSQISEKWKDLSTQKMLEKNSQQLQTELKRVFINNSDKQKSNDQTSKIQIDKKRAYQILNKTIEQFLSIFDEDNGGFSTPKFLLPSVLDFLIGSQIMNPLSHLDSKAIEMAITTLDKACERGIYDHVGDGFFRYSTDEFWILPHFEKMLCDQGLLVKTYLDAYKITQKIKFKEVARKTISFVFNYLYNKEKKMFYSSIDADSFPSEKGSNSTGKEKDMQELCEFFTIKENGNIPRDLNSNSNFVSKNIFYINKEKEHPINSGFHPEMISKSLKKLENFRIKNRKIPEINSNIICSWNCSMISALAQASSLLHSFDDSKNISEKESTNELAIYAQKTLESVIDNFVDLSTFEVSHFLGKKKGFLTDYAELVRALLDVYEYCNQDFKYVELANNIFAKYNELFWDSEQNNYWNFAKGEEVIMQTSNIFDGGEANPLTISIDNMIRLSYLLNNNDYLKKAKLFFEFSKRFQENPSIASSLLKPFRELYFSSPTQITILSNPKSEKAKKYHSYLTKETIPFSNFDESNKKVYYMVCQNETCYGFKEFDESTKMIDIFPTNKNNK